MAEDFRAKELGPVLKATRPKAVTQKSVASRLGLSDQTQVSRWESGEVFPAERRYVEYYANELGGGQELLELYDRLATSAQSDSLLPEATIERLVIERVFPAHPDGWLRSVEFRRIRANRDLASWDMTETYEWVVDDKYEVIPLGPENVELVYAEPVRGAEYPTITTKHKVVFPEIIRAGQCVEFTLLKGQRIDFDKVTEAGKEGYRQITPDNRPVRSLRIGIRFLGPRPDHLWHYAMERNLTLSSGMQHHGQPLNLDRFGYAWHEWESPDAGISCGIAWVW